MAMRAVQERSGGEAKRKVQVLLYIPRNQLRGLSPKKVFLLTKSGRSKGSQEVSIRCQAEYFCRRVKIRRGKNGGGRWGIL